MESRFDINEIKRACLIINTADYCQTTASEVKNSSFRCKRARIHSLTHSSSKRKSKKRLMKISKRKSHCKRNVISLSGISSPVPSSTSALIPLPLFYFLFIPVVSVISSAITLLLREVENATDVYFTTMIRSNWPALNQVSGQSHYVGELVKATEQVVETIKPLIEQKRYLRNFLDKVCR